MSIQFDNSYARLPDRFFARQAPDPVTKPSLISVNRPVAELLGLDADWLASPDGLAILAGNRLADGSDPIATVYAGHQFGSWNPQLGDGRAVLLGEVIGGDNQRYDLQLKGSGQTPYSRMGDGRSPLGPVLREYLISEAMAALGVPTSRSLAAVTTGEPVYREEALPGAILARVARSHIRIGTVQFFAARDDQAALQLLVDHVLQRHYPDAANDPNPGLALLDSVMRAQAELVVHWQMIGFIHGVMNTDNMLLSGETVDYGPCAFMDTYDPETVFSSIDHGGRYAYRNQPGIAHWNLACLAQALVPIIDKDPEAAVEHAKAALDKFPQYFHEANIQGLRAKLGLLTAQDDDASMAQQFLDLLHEEQADFTLAFRRLAEVAGPEPELSVRDLFDFSPAFNAWLEAWRTRCASEGSSDRQATMLNTNPAIIPRNHLVEAMIQAASENADYSHFKSLHHALANPYSLENIDPAFVLPPRPDQIVRQTFCGT